jgi:hypothetical protein
MASKTATPWGQADLVEELTLRQQAGGRRFASIVQLLETEKGSGSSASRTRRTGLRGAGR